MRNWSTDMQHLSKFPAQKQRFILESLINFGTEGQKINGSLLKKQLDNLAIDPKKKAYLAMLVS